MEKRIELRMPATTAAAREALRRLRAGELVYLSGSIYTGRDAAHKRFVAALERGEALPVELRDQAIYYVGPCPAPEGHPIGSCGPTTSSRMDAYAPATMKEGLAVMIGKGWRGANVVEAMKEYGCVYLAATGGAGALLASCVRRAEVAAYPELGPEAVYRLEVERMPLIVAIDSAGHNLYQEGPERYRGRGGE